MNDGVCARSTFEIQNYFRIVLLTVNGCCNELHPWMRARNSEGGLGVQEDMPGQNLRQKCHDR